MHPIIQPSVLTLIHTSIHPPTHSFTHPSVHPLIHASTWMDGWMDGFVCGWVNGWKEWMDGIWRNKKEGGRGRMWWAWIREETSRKCRLNIRKPNCQQWSLTRK